MRPRELILLLVLAAWLAACRQDSGESPRATQTATSTASWFEDITARVGLNFVHDSASAGRYLVPEQIGSGAALFDYDNDGRLDIYLVQNAGPTSPKTNGLFHQEPDGRFKDVSAGSGLDVAGFGMGAAAGDINNDGLPDLLLTEYGAVHLFLNSGRGRFVDVTSACGLDNPRWGTSAAFFDYDRDGWLDLVIANYLDYDPSQKCPDPKGVLDFCGPTGFPGVVAKLFHNLRRATPRFEDVTVSSGLAGHAGRGLGVVCADFDGDQWPDIFIADDRQPNRLFVNQRNGTFAEQAAQRGVAFNALGQPAANMGIALGDVDGNGLFDLFVTHLTEESHSLWMQESRGVFQDRQNASGLNRQDWRGTGFGAVLADLDLDGDLDLAFVNGRVQRAAAGEPRATLMPAVAPFWAPYAQRNQIFCNDGQGKFRDVSQQNPAFCGQAAVGRSLSCGDLDNDGALDLLVTTAGGPARVLRNIAPRGGHWLALRLLLPNAGNRDAYGAEIIVRAGNRQWWRLANPAYSYLGSNDPRVHFGLGEVSTVDAIEVLWPDGARERFPGGPVDRFLILRQGN